MFSKINFNTYAFVCKILGGSIGIFTISNYYNGSEKFYNNYIAPLINYLGIEKAHQWTFITNKYHLIPRNRYQDPYILKCEFYGVNISNPLGIGSGFDKEGETISSLFNIGFGFVEIGTVEINSCGITNVYDDQENNYIRIPNFIKNQTQNDSSVNIIKRIKKVKKNNCPGMVGINLNCKDTSDKALKDYIVAIKKFGPVVDYLAFNLNPRSEIKLEILIKTLRNTCNSLDTNKKPLLLLKLPPNFMSKDQKKLVTIINNHPNEINGIIVPQTEKNQQNEYDSLDINGSKRDINMIREIYQSTRGKLLIISNGGVMTGKDAYEKIKAGASLIQIYYPLIYYGPPRIVRIKKDLEQLLKWNGYHNISDAIGIDIRHKGKHYFFPFYD